MWLKKLFISSKTSEKDKDDNETNEKNKKFTNQDDSQLMTSAAVIDVQPDTRYQLFPSIKRNTEIQFPLAALHHTQYILFHQSNVFQAKTKQDVDWSEITIMLTDRQLLINPNIIQAQSKSTPRYCTISYGSIQKCQLIPAKKKIHEHLKILLKNNRELQITSPESKSLQKILSILNSFAFVKGVNKFYAFRFGSLHGYKQDIFKGWEIYNIKNQFNRQGLIITNDNQFNLKYVNNQNGELCSTYPEILVIPSEITDEVLKKCAQFRTKQRFPALTYFHQYNSKKYSTLFRCSQNKVGVRNARSKQDELMIQYIGDLKGSFLNNTEENKKVKNCKIYDARGFYSAFGNRIVGNGYENTEFYTNCKIQWLNIPNIHAVRQSYQLMMNYNEQNTNIFLQCAQSRWYDYLYLIIDGAKSIVKDLLSGINVIVHCSDGWDRTSQLCSLSQLIMDPYYRTIQGLAVLIQKDWRHFGHKFRSRTGQYNSVEYHPYEKSPVFIQFLDCIYQIIEQFPLSFQYNEKLLLFLAKNVDSNVYGSFMVNNIRQFKQLKLQQNTISIWSQIFQKRQQFINPYYSLHIKQSWLDIGTQAKYMTIWRGLLSDNKEINAAHEIMRSELEIKKSLQKKKMKNDLQIQEFKNQLKILNL